MIVAHTSHEAACFSRKFRPWSGPWPRRSDSSGCPAPMGIASLDSSAVAVSTHDGGGVGVWAVQDYCDWGAKSVLNEIDAALDFPKEQ